MTLLRRIWIAALLLASASLRADGRSELRLELVRESLTGVHRQYRQTIDGIPVVGSTRMTTTSSDGIERVTFQTLAAAPDASLVRTHAAPASSPGGGVLRYVNVDGVARLARMLIVEERRHELYAHYVDVENDAVLREDALFYRAKARVFETNPVARLNAPALRDFNDSPAAVPESAYSIVDIDVSPGSDGRPWNADVAIVDAQPPTTPPRTDSFTFDRSQPQFEEVNAFFHVQRQKQYLQSLGYVGQRGLVQYQIPVDAHGGETDSSYFVLTDFVNSPGEGTLFFGDGGTDDAEDSDIVIHEFAHAIHNWISPGGLTGAASSQARAIAEGFGDYWAFSATVDAAIASGRDPWCIADWDARCEGDDASQNCGYPAGADCLRRVDSVKTMRDFVNGEEPGTEHRNGAIWSSALREVFEAIRLKEGAIDGRRVSDQIVLESLFGLPPAPRFETVARKMIDADRRLRRGADVAAICSAMTTRGIFTAGDCATLPRGERTFIPSADVPRPIPDDAPPLSSQLLVSDTRLIEKLSVRVDIAHPNRGDLRITLVAPDGTAVRLKESSSVDSTPGLHATYGIDAPPAESLDRFRGMAAAGVWHLLVADVFRTDSGFLQSWSLVIQFAGDAPSGSRPAPEATARFIPAVGHVNGAKGSEYRSDLYLLNRGSRDAHLTLVYTPSGADGRAEFAAVNVTIAPDQTVAMHDVVAQLFSATGMGTLAVQGETSRVLVWSTTYGESPSGRLSQEVEAMTVADATERGGDPLFIAPIEPTMQPNLGLAEISGHAGVVQIDTASSVSGTFFSYTVPIAPFSHLQFGSAAGNAVSPVFARLTVIEGEARIIAYSSQVHESGDPMYVPARHVDRTATEAVVPALIDLSGRPGWASAMWGADVLRPERSAAGMFEAVFYPSKRPSDSRTFSDQIVSFYLTNVVRTLFEMSETAGHADLVIPAGQIFMTRMYHSPGRWTNVGERIDAVPKTSAVGRNAPVDAIGLQSTGPFRTNFGITEVDGQVAEVRITLYSAGGERLASTGRVLAPHEDWFAPLASLWPEALSDARLRFEVIAGDGRILAYASVIDGRSGDPAFVLAR